MPFARAEAKHGSFAAVWLGNGTQDRAPTAHGACSNGFYVRACRAKSGNVFCSDAFSFSLGDWVSFTPQFAKFGKRI